MDALYFDSQVMLIATLKSYWMLATKQPTISDNFLLLQLTPPENHSTMSPFCK